MKSTLERAALAVLLAAAMLLPAVASAQEPSSGQAAIRLTTYVVRAGDTLSGIAVRFDTTVEALVRENALDNPALISVGQQLVIPGAAPQPAAGPAPLALAPPPARIVVRRPLGEFHALPIGRTAMGRSVQVDCAGQGETVVLLVGGIHTGHEANTVELVAKLEVLARAGQLSVPPDIWLCFLPALNLDGIALGTHTNARGVDLNRNWPARNWFPKAFHPATGQVPGGTVPLSEPETRALYEFIQAARPALVISWHCCAYVVEANTMPHARAAGRQYADAIGVDYIERWTAYRITGEFIRALEEIGIPAIDVELPHSGAPSVADHQAAVEAVLAELTGR